MLSAIYAAIACLLLINLLIASFNTTYQKVEEASERTWSYHRADLISEYFKKPVFPPPLNIIYHLFQFVYRICKRCCRCGVDELENSMDAENENMEKLDTALDDCEKAGMNQYIRRRKRS